MCNGAFGGELAAEARRKASVRIKLFHASNVDCLDELIQLALVQKERVILASTSQGHFTSETCRAFPEDEYRRRSLEDWGEASRLFEWRWPLWASAHRDNGQSGTMSAAK